MIETIEAKEPHGKPRSQYIAATNFVTAEDCALDRSPRVKGPKRQIMKFERLGKVTIAES